MNTVCLGIVTEDPPIKEGILASGMCRVNARMFQAIEISTALIVTQTLSNHYHSQDIVQNLQNKSFVLSIPEFPKKFLRRLLPDFNYEEAIYNLSLPTITRQLRSRNANWIFCPCGVNPIALWKGLQLARISNLPFAVYLVDDFLSGAILSGNKEHLKIAEQHVPKWISDVNQIFVISEGLRQRVQELYNLDSVVLPLPYDLPESPTECDYLPERKEQIIFVGSLSHFYVDGLRQMAAILDQINQERGTSLTLRFTLPDINQVRQLVGEFNCIRCAPCKDSQSLRQEITSSLLCFAPYSFDPKYREMVISSFPSKMLDYLALGKFIITYAPHYASSIMYFKSHNLPTTIDFENIDTLRQVILNQIESRNDFSQKYREVVSDFHSPDAIADKIISTLELHQQHRI